MVEEQSGNRGRHGEERWRDSFRLEENGRHLERNIDDELHFHLESRIAELREQGLSEDQARARAREVFGRVAEIRKDLQISGEEELRRRRLKEILGEIGRDLQFAARRLRRNPGFTTIATLLLALGIAVNTIIFSILNGAVLTPLPYPDPEELVFIWERNEERGRLTSSSSDSNYLSFRDGNTTFAELAAISWHTFVALPGEHPVRAQGFRVTHNLPAMLGITPVLGRSFTPEEDAAGAGTRVAMISSKFWQTHLGGVAEVVGSTLNLDGEPWTVVGVLPELDNFPGNYDIWIPLRPDPAWPRDNHLVNLLGRMHPGVTVEQAWDDLAAVAAELGREYPESNAGWSVTVRSFDSQLVGAATRSSLWMIMAAVGLLLLIACVNLASLLLARALGRRREIAIATAFGAGRGQAIRQVVSESLLLALGGGLIGIMLALWGIEALPAIASDAVPRLAEIGIDWPVLLFTLLITIGAGTLSGLIPALQASSARPAEVLREGGRHGGSSRRAVLLRRGLVVVEIGLSIVLLIGAGLLLRSFHAVRNVDPGFEVEDRICAGITLPESRYSETMPTYAFLSDLVHNLTAVPEIENASLIQGGTALYGGLNATMEVDPASRALEEGEERLSADWRMVMPGYFATMGIALHAGRDFTFEDVEQAWGVCVISENLAARLYPEGDAVGKTVNLWATPERSSIIIGIAASLRERRLTAEERYAIYMPMWLLPPIFEVPIVMHTPVAVADAATILRRVVGELDPELPVYDIRSYDGIRNDSIAGYRSTALVISLFAAVALLLAAAGVVGVMSYTVSRRGPEIGVRIAVGATGRDIVQLVLGQGLGLAALGTGMGLLAALALSSILSEVLYETSTLDPITWFGVVAVLIVTAVGATLLPALRASRIDPVRVLNTE